MKAVAIIPSRLQSSRLPEKALKDIQGIPMIVHVAKRCLYASSLTEVYVATDSREIEEVVLEWGGNVVMTSDVHQSGTDRIAEAAQSIEADIIVNVQGDEALVNPSHIDKVVDMMFQDSSMKVGILVNDFTKKNSPGDIKVVLNEKSEVMYFSRNDIPSSHRSEVSKMLKAYHVVPFQKDFLIDYASWSPTKLELVEFNEYLRILEKGEKIKAVKVDSAAVSVDTEEDLIKVRQDMKEDYLFLNYSKEEKKNFLNKS